MTGRSCTPNFFKKTTMQHYNQAYIRGEWQEVRPLSTLIIHDSFSEQPLAEVALADAALAARAVAAAKDAFERWSRTPVAERTALLRKVGEALAQETDTLAEAITREVGMPLKLSKRIQVQAPVAAWFAYADMGDNFSFESTVKNSIVTQEPVGVVACITPWNYPLHQITAKVAPALAAGCTVVLKPSELAPASAYALARAIDTAGLPPGVFNMMIGEGPVVGEALVGDADVDMVSFTGSTAAGKRVASVAGNGIKRVALELGGKSASVVLPDADMALAMRHALGACYLNSGQTCTAITRVLVPAARYDECADLLRQGAAAFTMGDPLQAATRLGPLVSATQSKRVKAYIDEALSDSAECIAGANAAAVPATGYFVAPTVLGKVRPDARIAQEEVFGPVLSVIAYDDASEAVRIANGTPYGLAAAVWSGDRQQALSIARQLRAGQVDINGAPFNPAAPFGGFKMSGVGRENGIFGLEEFLEPRAIQLPL
jgi:acyl-CoA reductase-like NAD-dependent aldehyde dehydrogenase